MGLSIYDVLSRLGPHPTAPAPPPPAPGAILQSDKKYGSPIPLVFGRVAVQAQAVYVNKASTSTGNGFSPGGFDQSVGVTWKQVPSTGHDVVFAICEAPVTSILGVWLEYQGMSVNIPLADLQYRLCIDGGSLEIITAATAAAWAGYAGTPSAGLAHSGTVQARFQALSSGVAGDVPRLKFEVQGSSCVTATSTPDAHFADLLVFLLTDTTHGLGWPTGKVNVETGADGLASSSFRRYLDARGWYGSRGLVQGDSIASVIEDILAVTNSTLVWIDGMLTAIPLDDEASFTDADRWPGHATSPYTPVTSVVSIGPADYAVDEGQDPVKVGRVAKSKVFSVYPLDYTLRHSEVIGGHTYNSYTVNHAEVIDETWASANGLRRAPRMDLQKWVLKEGHALRVCQCAAQRAVRHRTKYTTWLKPRHCLVAPGDFLALSETKFGLSSLTVRVETVEEQVGGVIQVVAREWPLGSTKGFTASATTPSGLNPSRIVQPLATYDQVMGLGGGNLLTNAGLGTDANADGIADNFGVYNNSAGLEPITPTIQASGGVDGGKYQRLAWSVNNTTSKGLYLTGSNGNLWQPNKTYVWSFYARASGTNLGQTMNDRWNTNPSAVTWLVDPPLTASWQRYVVRLTWGATVDANGFITIAYGSGTQGTLDIDHIMVQEGSVPTEWALSVNEAKATADAAATAASAAQTTANGKNTITRSAAPPTSPAPVANDYWLNTDTTANCPDNNCKGHTLAAGVPQVGAYPHRKTYWPHIYNGTAWVDARGTEVIVAGDMLADSFATSDYTYSGTQNTASEVATQGARMRNNSAVGTTLPAILADGKGIKVGSYTLDEPVLSALTALARTGVAVSDVCWYRGNIDPGYNSGAPVFCDPLWARSTLFKVGARVQGDPSPAGYPLAEYNAASGNKATKVYRCITEGTSAATGNGPTGTTADITDGTAHWAYVEAATSAIERLHFYGEIGISYDSYTTQLCAVRCVLQPRAANDNLDGLRYLRVKWYGPGTQFSHTSYHAMPDRLYRTPATPTDAGNSVTLLLPTMVRGGVAIVYSVGAFVFSGYLRVKLFGVQGETPERDHGQAPNDTTTVFPAGGILIGGTGGEGGGGDGGGGACPAPEVGVLLADGTYRPAGLLRVGDRVWTVGEDEGPGQYQVTAVEVYRESERLALTLDDGTRLVYSPRHPVMTPSGWRAVKNLRPGERVLGIHGERRVASVLPVAAGPVVKLSTSGRTYVTEGGALNHNLKAN